MLFYASIAQLEEHSATNREVGGSNPSGRASFIFVGVVAQFWLEHWTVNSEVAGSSPVHPAK